MSDRTGIGCIVLREDRERPVLLLRRAFGDFLDEWCFVAGTVEAGEAPIEAVHRELREETGLTAERVRAVDRIEGPHLDLHVFVAHVGFAEDVVLDREHSAYAWCSFDVADERLPMQAQRRALRQARSA